MKAVSKLHILLSSGTTLTDELVVEREPRQEISCSAENGGR
jgi:hypothetical protein